MATGPSTSADPTSTCCPSSLQLAGTSPSTIRASQKESSSHFQLILFLPRLILVDSTRAGKRLPDALSKTVPIWCAVINRATYLRTLVERRAATGTSAPTDEQAEEEEEEDYWNGSADLHTPPGTVSAHEHAQIAARLSSWAAALAVRHHRNFFFNYYSSCPPARLLIVFFLFFFAFYVCACTGLVVHTPSTGKAVAPAVDHARVDALPAHRARRGILTCHMRERVARGQRGDRGPRGGVFVRTGVRRRS